MMLVNAGKSWKVYTGSPNSVNAFPGKLDTGSFPGTPRKEIQRVIYLGTVEWKIELRDSYTRIAIKDRTVISSGGLE
jgi:hypothetical protein